jgi:hypothetical protein
VKDRDIKSTMAHCGILTIPDPKTLERPSLSNSDYLHIGGELTD